MKRDMPEMAFVRSEGGYKFCTVKVENGMIFLVYKKTKPKKELISREVEIELMEFYYDALASATEYCRRTGQQYDQEYLKLTYRAPGRKKV